MLLNLFEMEKYKGQLTKLFETREIEVSGEINGRYSLKKVTADIDDAISGVKYILIVTPAFAHKAYAELLKGRVNKEKQIIVLYPGAFGALLFKTILGNSCPVIAETNNLPYDTRITEPCKVTIYGYNPTNIAFMPADKGNKLFSDLTKIHPFVRLYRDVLEAGLSIVNPAFMPGSVFSVLTILKTGPKGRFSYMNMVLHHLQ